LEVREWGGLMRLDLFGGQVAKSRSDNRKLAEFDFTGVLAAVGTGETRRGPWRNNREFFSNW